MLGAEALDLGHLDVGVLGPVYGLAANPPVGTGQAGGQISAGPCGIPLPGSARPGDDLTVRGLPELDGSRLTGQHDTVIPAPHHGGVARYFGDGHQMTRRDPFLAWRREPRRIPDRDSLPSGQDLAGIFLDT